METDNTEEDTWLECIDDHYKIREGFRNKNRKNIYNDIHTNEFGYPPLLTPPPSLIHFYQN